MKDLEKIILDMHGVRKTKALLKHIPKGATKIAVNLYKCGSIFYKEKDHKIYVDYLIGQKWQLAQHTDFISLSESLQAISFVLVDIALLKKEIELRGYEDNVDLKRLEMLEQQVNTQIEKVDLRREHAEDANASEYWTGHAEAYEIVKHMIRNFKNLNMAA